MTTDPMTDARLEEIREGIEAGERVAAVERGDTKYMSRSLLQADLEIADLICEVDRLRSERPVDERRERIAAMAMHAELSTQKTGGFTIAKSGLNVYAERWVCAADALLSALKEKNDAD